MTCNTHYFLNFVQYVYIKMVITVPNLKMMCLMWGISVPKLGLLHFNIKIIGLCLNIIY